MNETDFKELVAKALKKNFFQFYGTKVEVLVADEGFHVVHCNPDLRDLGRTIYKYAKTWNDGDNQHYDFPIKVEYVPDQVFHDIQA